MPDFRLYLLHPDSGHITGVEELHEADDDAAVHAVRSRGHVVPVELWEDGRKITRLDAPRLGAGFMPLGVALT